MPISTKVTDDIVFNAVDETTTSREMAEYISAHVAEWANHGVLWNLCKATLAGITPANISEMKHIVANTSSMPTGIKTAIYVESPVGFGLARMFELLTEGNGKYYIRVFRNQEDAIAWLME